MAQHRTCPRRAMRKLNVQCRLVPHMKSWDTPEACAYLAHLRQDDDVHALSPPPHTVEERNIVERSGRTEIALPREYSKLGRWARPGSEAIASRLPPPKFRGQLVFLQELASQARVLLAGLASRASNRVLTACDRFYAARRPMVTVATDHKARCPTVVLQGELHGPLVTLPNGHGADLADL